MENPPACGVFGMVTVYPIGTTIYDPDRCYNGYTIFSFDIHEPEARLIDMNGNIVNKWNSIAARVRLLKNGNVLVVERRREERKSVVAEYSWEGDLIWEYEPPGTRDIHAFGPARMDVQRLENGNTLVLAVETVPEEYRKKIRDPVRKSVNVVFADYVLEVTPDKKTVWEWHYYEHLDINRYCEMCNPGDWTHNNTIQPLPENRHYDAGDERFKPGNVLLSPRNLGFILIADKDTKEIVWEYSGTYAGGLAGQHEPHMIEKGLPGEGNIIVFDNGAPVNMKTMAHTGKSFVLEIDPATERLVWKYENGEEFYSAYRSNVQRLPNGNTLICESMGQRLFEVTQEGEIVWEYALEWNRILGRAYRYPCDHCPQLASLGKPKEERVVPPPHVRTRPMDWQVYSSQGVRE